MDIKYVQTDQSCICPMCKKWVLFGFVSIQNNMYKECPSCKGIILHSTTTSSTSNNDSIAMCYNENDPDMKDVFEEIYPDDKSMIDFNPEKDE